MKHIEINHKEVFQIINDLKRKRIENGSNKRQKTLDTFVTKKKVSVEIDCETVKRALVNLLTVDGRPFSMINDIGFRMIINPILSALNMCVNLEKLNSFINEEYDKVKLCLEFDLKGKLLPIKMDIVKKRDRSVLGVNVQFVKNDELIIKTLAMKDLTERHTGNYTLNVLKEILNKFSIEEKMIFSITTDNGSNMIKAVKDLAHDLEDDDEDDADDLDVSDDELMVADDVNILKSVRCAAHTLQLAIKDFFDLEVAKKVLIKARLLATTLRSTNNVIMIKKLKLKKAILDCTTRWCSTYDMFERICQDMDIDKSLNITNDDWAKFSCLKEVLQPVSILNKTIQTAQLLAGDFLASWMKTKIEIKNILNEYAILLLNCLANREKW